MHIALAHNRKRQIIESEAEFDIGLTIRDITRVLRSLGHTVLPVELNPDKPSAWSAPLLRAHPHLVFNIAEGRGTRYREAHHPAVYEALGLPYTGSDPYVLTVTQDKWLTKRILADGFLEEIMLPDLRITEENYGNSMVQTTLSHFVCDYYVIKPLCEGSSVGVQVVPRNQFREALDVAVHSPTYKLGVLVEEYMPGVDITVPWLELHDSLDAYRVTGVDVYDYESKHHDVERSQLVLDRSAVGDQARALTEEICILLGIRDLARVDFRLGANGQLYFLEVNALPSLERNAGEGYEHVLGAFAQAAKDVGHDYTWVIDSIVQSAELRNARTRKRSR